MADAYFEVYALLESVCSGAVGALRGSYVVSLNRAKKNISRRQDLPAEAFWQPAELQKMHEELVAKFGKEEAAQRFCMLFVALSYRWLQKGNPDPDRYHLSAVAGAARMYIESKEADSLQAQVFVPLKRAKDVDFALFWDFASLYQAERTEEQAALFGKGLRASNIWYGHRYTTMWMQSSLPRAFDTAKFPTYDSSGWCYVEASLSSLLKPGRLRLDLGKRDGSSSTYAKFMKSCVAGRVPPQPPELVASLLREEKVFTARSDVETVVGLYNAFFSAVAPQLTDLRLDGLQWGEAEAEALAGLLPHFGRLTSLDVSRNKIGAAGLQALIAHAPDTLSSLSIAELQVGTGWFDSLFDERSLGRQLRYLDVTGVDLHGDALVSLGAKLEAHSKLAGFKCTAFEAPLDSETLDIPQVNIGGQYRMGPGTGVVLGAIISHSPCLTALRVQGSALGDVGTSAIATALMSNTLLTSLDLEGQYSECLGNSFPRNLGIGPKAASVFASLFQTNRTLTALSLKLLNIGETRENDPDGRQGWAAAEIPAAHALADAIWASTTLATLSGIPLSDLRAGSATELDLRTPQREEGTGLPFFPLFGGLGVIEAMVLAKIVRESTTLQSLELGWARIGDEGAKALGRALGEAKTLTRLDTRGSLLSEAAATELSTAVLASATLLEFGTIPIQSLRADSVGHLELTNRRLGRTEVLVLGQLLANAKTLRTISLVAGLARPSMDQPLLESFLGAIDGVEVTWNAPAPAPAKAPRKKVPAKLREAIKAAEPAKAASSK